MYELWNFFYLFVTLLPSAEAPCEFFEGWKFVAFSLLWSIKYLPGDGGCGKKSCCLRVSAISVDSLSLLLLNVIHVFRCLISFAKHCICFCISMNLGRLLSISVYCDVVSVFFSLLPLVSFEYQVAVIGRFCRFSLLLVLLNVFLISALLILRNKFYLLVPHRRAAAYDICLAFGSCSSRKSSSWVMHCWVCLDLYFSWLSFLSFRCFSERSRMVWFVLCFDFLGKCLLQVYVAVHFQ